jgi:hypothetical protein
MGPVRTTTHRLPAARGPASLVAVLVAALLTLGIALGPAPTAGARAAQASGPTLTLVDQTTWLQDGDPFSATVRVTDAPAGSSIAVVAHGVLQSRGEFQESLAGELGSVAYEGDPAPVRVPPTGGNVEVVIPAEADLGQGVRPVAIQLRDADGEVLASLVTYLTMVRRTEGLTPLSVAVVLDIASPPALQPDGSVVMSTEALDRIEERVTALEQVPDVPWTVAPRPETVDSLAGLDERGLNLLDRLDRVTNDLPVLARPFTDIDIAALMDADLVSELNNQAEAGANVVRTRLHSEPAPEIWLVPGTIGEPAATLLNQVGVGHAIVDREAVAQAPGMTDTRVPEQPVRLGESGPVAMVNDGTLAARLTGQEGVLDAQRFVAELAAAWLEQPAVPRGVVVRVPADADLDPDVLARALTDLADPKAAEAIDPVTASDIFGVPPIDADSPPVATPAGHAPTADLAPLSTRLQQARGSIAGIAGVRSDADLARSLEHSLLLATGIDTPDDQRNLYIRRVTTELSKIEGLVDAPDEFRITLTSRSGSVPLNLTNSSDGEIPVRIELQSDQLDFPDGDVMLETLEPGATRIDIPVRVLASGAFPLDIRVTTQDGSVELEETRFDIRSTAVSGVGLVLSVGAVLVLAIWWLRNWRATVRSRQLVPADAAGQARVPTVEAPAGATPEEVGALAAAAQAEAEPVPPRPTAPWGPPTGPPAGPPPDAPGAPGPPGGQPAPPADPAPGEGDDDDGYRPAHLSSPRRHR